MWRSPRSAGGAEQVPPSGPAEWITNNIEASAYGADSDDQEMAVTGSVTAIVAATRLNEAFIKDGKSGDYWWPHPEDEHRMTRVRSEA